jgi:hypothetical protein
MVTVLVLLLKVTVVVVPVPVVVVLALVVVVVLIGASVQPEEKKHAMVKKARAQAKINQVNNFIIFPVNITN